MFLYQQYCYETILEVQNSFESQGTFGDAYIYGVNSNNATSFKYNLAFPDGVGGFNLLTGIVNSPASCTELGFDNSYSGMTLDDYADLAGASSLVLLLAALAASVRRVFF